MSHVQVREWGPTSTVLIQSVYTQEEWDEYYDSLSEEEKAQIEIIEESDDFIDDSEVKSRLQISDEKWNSFSETEREQARELYERLK